MKESLEDLKAIIDNAPQGATHYDVHYYRYSGDEVQSAPSKRFEWEFVSDGSAELELTRSLSDIERIVELMEWQVEANKNYQSMMGAYLNE